MVIGTHFEIIAAIKLRVKSLIVRLSPLEAQLVGSTLQRYREFERSE